MCISRKRQAAMKHRRTSENYPTIHDEATEPALPSITVPLPVTLLPQQSWISRFMHGIGLFFAAIIHKINQLLALGLAVLLLLLFTRFILSFFHLTLSQFSAWVFFASDPLVTPFQGLVPALPYGDYTVDVTTLIAIVVYALVVTIVRQFLRVLAGR